ncbi:alpha/beta fold hydrolase [Hydrogenophaga sp. RWCD_12]|uniref:alpha/beta fold hydrolase n=1 Tax=Hydrogenophaga sp. RWCD_12 TaxID=3391190 RepID=UPI003984A2F0
MTNWVFLRGLTRESAHWGTFPALFQAAIPGSTVHLIDLPGNGQQHRDTSPCTVAGMVDACRAERRRLGAAGPVHLLAMSMGAMVATEWARVAPEELAACVLINTSLRPFSPFHHRLQPRNYLALCRLVMGGLNAQEAEREVFRMTCNHPDQQRDTVERWTQVRTQRPVAPRNALRQLLAAARYRAPLQAPSVPMLLLSSAQDHLVSSRCSQAMASAWGCPLKTHPSAGHDLPQDAPRWVAQQVRDWVTATRT